MTVSSCRTMKPIHDTDAVIHIELTRDYVRDHASTDTVTGNMGMITSAGGGYIPVVTEIELTLIAGGLIIDFGEFVFKGCDVYVYPEGYKDTYKQQVYWGRNKIYLPQDFAEHEGALQFTIEGTYAGSWVYTYKPGKSKNVSLSKKKEKKLSVTYTETVELVKDKD